LAFLKKNPLLGSAVRNARGRHYGGVKHPEDVEAEDLADMLNRSDMPDIMQKLLEREKALD